MKMAIMVTPAFLASAQSLDKNAKGKLIKALNLLAGDVRHPSLQSKRVMGAASEVFEARVDQELRMIYDRIGEGLRCWYVGHHDDAIKHGATLKLSQTLDVDDIEVNSPSEPIVHGGPWHFVAIEGEDIVVVASS